MKNKQHFVQKIFFKIQSIFRMILSNTIYLAGGCFWGTEHFLKLIPGVISTEVGYANGVTDKPKYEEVYTDTTGYTETVKVVYNPKQIDLAYLLELFFKTIDPTSLNKQGNDIGTRYRTGIYYQDPNHKPIIDQAIAKLALEHNNPIVIENKPLTIFHKAEEYHQNYLTKNPTGYCHISSDLFELAKNAHTLNSKNISE